MKTLKEKVKNYLQDLCEDESGMELLQVAIVILLVAALIVIIVAIFALIRNKLTESKDELEESLQNVGSQGSTRTSPSTPN